MKQELYKYIKKILAMTGVDALKEPRRFYAFLMDVATEHIDDVRMMAKDGDDKYLAIYYRCRRSDVDQIYKASLKGFEYLKENKGLDEEDARRLADQMGRGLAAFVHPRKAWPAPVEEKKKPAQNAKAAEPVRKARPEVNSREQTKNNPKPGTILTKHGRRIQMNSTPPNHTSSQTQAAAPVKPAPNVSTPKQPTATPKPARTANRWVPIWEQPNQGSKAVPRKPQVHTAQDDAEEELARIRRTKVSMQRQEKARKKLHEETLAMFSGRRTESLSAQNRQTLPTWKPQTTVSQTPKQDDTFEFWKDDWNTGRAGYSNQSSQGFREKTVQPATSTQSSQMASIFGRGFGIQAGGTSGGNAVLQSTVKIVTEQGETLRTVEKGARMPLHLTIYPRSASTFAEGVSIYTDSRKRYRLKERSGQTREYLYLQLTIEPDFTLKDIVLSGSMNRKTYDVEVTSF